MKSRKFAQQLKNVRKMKFPKIQHVANSLLRPKIWGDMQQQNYLKGFQKALMILSEINGNSQR